MRVGIWKKREKLRFIIWLVAGVTAALVSIIVAVATQATDSPRPRQASPIAHLTTALTEEYGSLVIVADKQGYFRDQGVDVTIKNYASGSPLMADLLAGKLDCGIASDFAGVLSTFHGQDIRILASAVQYETFFLVARKDHSIANIGDIRHKRIGVTRVTAGEFFLGQFLTFNGLTPQDLTIVDMPPADLAASLENGSIDGAVLFEPNAYPVVQKLGSEAIQWSVQPLQPGYGLLYCRGRLVRDEPEALVRYMRAIVGAEQYIRNHSDQARDYTAHYLGYDQQYITYMWPKLTLEARLDQTLIINMNDEAKWAIENHATDATEAPNYLNFIYFPPLEAANPEGVAIIH